MPALQVAHREQLFEYMHTLLSYLTPPVAATFLLAVFCKRVTEQVGGSHRGVGGWEQAPPSQGRPPPALPCTGQSAWGPPARLSSRRRALCCWPLQEDAFLLRDVRRSGGCSAPGSYHLPFTKTISSPHVELDKGPN